VSKRAVAFDKPIPPTATPAALATRGTMLTIGTGAFFYPFAAGVAVGGIGLSNATARLLTNQGFVKWLAEAPKIKPEAMALHTQRLLQSAMAAKDAQYQEDVQTYLQLVEQASKNVR
jgi:hypothetical protein